MVHPPGVVMAPSFKARGLGVFGLPTHALPPTKIGELHAVSSSRHAAACSLSEFRMYVCVMVKSEPCSLTDKAWRIYIVIP
ncbi:hypothetical protein EJB05_35958 [Eragrostis curvula]|uniref:Uncharacterized protein n=1 Tax=Eragrostis curvula TaxID=38414 RepID=A0A5J9U8X2_9POAL|nr:hypothetical protein EJB05_35958 [Eragrostis curvula]